MTIRRIYIGAAALVLVLIAAALLGVSFARADGKSSKMSSDELLIALNERMADDPNRTEQFGKLTRAEVSVFSVSKGDLVDVDLLVGKGNTRCITVSGGAYSGGSASCFDRKEADSTGSWLAIPAEGGSPAIAVGVLPRGKAKAKIKSGGMTVDAEIRHGIFLAKLPDSTDLSSVESSVLAEFSN